MDFNLKPNATSNSTYPNFEQTILEETELKVNGNTFRELIIGRNEAIDSWVEDIGYATGYGLLTGFNVPTTACYIVSPDQIESCYDNGYLLFDKSNFSVAGKQTDSFDDILKVGKWWILDVVMKSGEKIEAKAEITNSYARDGIKLFTVEVDCGSASEKFEVFENNHRLYVADDIDYPIIDMAMIYGCTSPLYTLNPSRTEVVPLSDKGLVCCATSLLSVKGKDYLESVILFDNDPKNTVCWVEGIGVSRSAWITENASRKIEHFTMKVCGQEDTVLFTAADFSHIAASATAIPAVNGISTPIYDLQGHRIYKPHAGKIYISDKRVFKL